MNISKTTDGIKNSYNAGQKKVQLNGQKPKVTQEQINNSRQTALAILELFPKAKIFAFCPYTFRGQWGDDSNALTAEQIKTTKNKLFGLKMSSVDLCLLDFDIKSETHPTGMTEQDFWEWKKKFNLIGYPFFTVGKSGNGGHCWFLLTKEAPQVESGTDAINGLDYKVNSIVFLNKNPFPNGTDGLQPLPQAFLDIVNKKRHLKELSGKTEHREFGPGKNNKAIPQRAGKAGSAGSLSLLGKAISELWQNNPGNPENPKHTIDLLNKTAQSWIPAPDPNQDYKPVAKKNPTYTLKETEKMLMDALYKLQNDHIKKLPDKNISPTFWDDSKIMPKNNLFLLSGGTECGKTEHSFNQHIKPRLVAGDQVIIWEHSETNRMNRLNEWLKSIKFEGNNLLMTPYKMEVIENIAPDVFLFIDDTDSFFRIKRTTDRREVADKLELMSWICQLVGFSALCCHFQTKTSRKEKDPQLRSGGDMSWVNKIRYGGLIEKAMREIEGKQVESSYLTLQKGYRTHPDSAWWLKPDKTIDLPITKQEVSEIIQEKIEGDNLRGGIFKETVEEYFGGSRTMETKTLYQQLVAKFGLKTDTVYKKLRRLGYHFYDNGGFGHDRKYYISKDPQPKKPQK